MKITVFDQKITLIQIKKQQERERKRDRKEKDGF